MGKRPGRRKVRGQARANALALFGLASGKMERASDREQMALVLRHSADDRMRAIARDALDPLWRQKSFAAIVEMRQANYHDVSEEYRKILRQEGLMRAANHLPDLMEQTAIDARSRDERCKACKGKGTVLDQKSMAAGKKEALARGEEFTDEIWVECGTCSGGGTVHVLGDTDRLKMMFDTFGLTGKERGLNVNLDLRNTRSDEDLTTLAASIAPVLEGEIAPPSKEDES